MDALASEPLGHPSRCHTRSLPSPFRYFNPIFSTNCKGSWTPNGTYHQTDIIRDKGLAFVDQAVAKGKPFFIELAPTGPHDQQNGTATQPGPVAVPCARHANMYTNVKMPLSPNWGYPLPKIMNMTQAVDYRFSNSKYIPRLQTLAGIDELVDAMVTKLDSYGILQNTYFIFTSDNGFRLGHHSLQYNKWILYEEVRGR